MVAVTWFSHFLWGPSLYHWGEGGCPPSVFTKVWPTHKSIMASGILEIPPQSERKKGSERQSIVYDLELSPQCGKREWTDSKDH